MLRITPSASSAGAKKYFGEGLQRADYYLQGQEVVGLWGGKAAERLGLKGEVDRASFHALCDNRTPQGERLTARDKGNRRVGYDFTFSAPKSVSVLYELSGDERILDAFRASVGETMREIESEMKTRVRGKGADNDRTTGNLVWAEFVHFTSRPVDGVPDPHLHAHMYAFNATWDAAEGRWKAGQFGDVKRDAPYYQAAFDARLAGRLNELGYATVKDCYSFEIAGIAESVRDRFSQRRNRIERIAAQKGITDPEAKHEITRRGRERKVQGVTREELRREWDKRLAPDERAALLDAMDGRAQPSLQVNARQAMDFAVDHSFARQSVVPQKHLKAEALRFGVGSVTPDEVNAALAGREDTITVALAGREMVTTETLLQRERAMLQFAREGRSACAPFAAQADLPDDLSGEQRAAALHVLRSRDRVTGVIGGAGTGKTYLMSATIKAIEDGGSRVRVFAPSAQASRGVLRASGFANAETLQLLLTDHQLQERVAGNTLWVDEAGLVSTRDMARLFEIAKRNGNRVVLSGDYRQHGSVEAGDAFRLIESEAGIRYAALQEIRRQKPAAYRKAVKAISQATPAGLRRGFEALDNMGAIVQVSGDERQERLIADYLKAARSGESALIIAPTHAEGDALTAKLRDALKAEGRLDGSEHACASRVSTGWTPAQKRDPRLYRSGMVVEFHQNIAGERARGERRKSIGGFTKGESAVVEKVSGETVTLVRENGARAALPLRDTERFEVYRVRQLQIAKGERVRITKNGALPTVRETTARVSNGDVDIVESVARNGDVVLKSGVIVPRDYGHIAPGYVDTSYASQGKSVDRVLIAVGDTSLPAVNAQQWYVSVSRGKLSAKVYVEDKAEVKAAMLKSGERLSAVELLQHQPRDVRRSRVREFLDRYRAGRFVNERIDVWREHARRPQRTLEPAHA